MSQVFADSFFFFGLVNPSDRAHRQITTYIADHSGRIVTTWWVLIEVADGLAAPANRSLVIELLDWIQQERCTSVV